MDVKAGKANLYKQASSVEPKVTDEKKAKSLIAPIAGVTAEKKESAGAGTSVKAEYQMSGTAQQANLNDQFQQKISFITEGYAQKNPVHTQFMSPPILKTADSRTVAFDGLAKDHAPQFERRVLPDPRGVIRIPRTLLTGSGNDTVDIQMGPNGRISVMVNGKQAWNGSPEEFQNLTIDTGEGNDVVINNVSGATIITGNGADKVVNRASKASINTGDGCDVVVSIGDSNQIATGNDADSINSMGNKNEIIRGLGDDFVSTIGSENVVRTGFENDTTQLILNDLRDVTKPVPNANDRTQLVLDIIVSFNRVRSSVSGDDDSSKSFANTEAINNDLKRLVEALPISPQAQSKMISEVLVLFDRVRADEERTLNLKDKI